MRPLSELGADDLGDVVGVVFDVDDTVTRDGRLEREAYEAMWRLADAGVGRIAVTGRPLGWADVIARQWPVDVAVGENGAGWVWREGELVHEDYFHPEADVRARQRVRRDRIRRTVATELPDVRVARDQRARRCDLAFDVGEHEHLPADVVERLVEIVESMGARAPVSSVHCHVVLGDWDKAAGVMKAGHVAGWDLDGDRARFVFVGDSGNDAAAFAHFPITVGVANVRSHLDRLPTPPRFVTDADRGRGFAEVVDHLLAAR